MDCRHAALVLLLVVVSHSRAASLGRAGEEAPYTLVETGPGWEVRRYPATTWITTDPVLSVLPHSGPEREAALAKLHRYIAGANMAGMEVAAVAPLCQRILPGAAPASPSNSSLAFPLPAELQAGPPDPTELGLLLAVWPEHLLVARQFSGQAGELDWAVELTELYRLARARGLAVTPVPQYTAEYSESDVTPGRRNEVWLEVTASNL